MSRSPTSHTAMSFVAAPTNSSHDAPSRAAALAVAHKVSRPEPPSAIRNRDRVKRALAAPLLRFIHLRS